ncbi:MarR family transcriptional regulator [Paenarthrobacter sp. Z7-10]|uniref:MarR family transcriptional regulator n=1 Tax=Paenarthrobacter sp. Z7-10 TaxID=2787635 RepID=UPI0022A95716|nr:MarR family transcriptional regulator [Paenarthrobacter sp. Z7-10]MCZ2402723.1 MarR family transcriptional regulator [Paenarthrobacter sp. Z7-10]
MSDSRAPVGSGDQLPQAAPDLDSWPTTRLLSTAGRLAEHVDNKILATQKLTMSSFTALLCLSAAGPLSQAALADSLRIRPQTVGKLLQGLEKDGLITRDRGVPDRRSTKVALTDHGSEVLQRAREAINVLSLEDPDRSAELRLRLEDLIDGICAMDTDLPGGSRKHSSEDA